MKDTNLNKVNKTSVILVFALAFYMVSAIAYESTASTARISTIAIYFLFIIGGYYVFQNNIIHFGIYPSYTVLFTLFVFLMCTPLSLSSGPDLTQTVYHVAYVNFTCMVLCVIVYMIIYHKPILIKWVMMAAVIGAVILAIRVIDFYGDVATMLEYASDTNLREHRVGTEIINANLLGLYMSNATFCSIILALVAKGKKFIKRSILIILSVGFVALALLAGSKKTILSILIGVITIAVFIAKGRNSGDKIRILFVGILAFVLIIWAVSTLDFFATLRLRIDSLFTTLSGEHISRTDQARSQYITEGLGAFWESPIFGNGTGYSYKLFGTYSHNNFVELLMSYGIVGFGLFYIPQLLLILKLYRRVKTKDMFAVYFLAYVIIQLFIGVAFVSYYERITQMIIAAAWGYCDSRKREVTRSEIEKYI